MLKSLNLQNVGPAPDLHADFADRLNVITGDNGLGKSFLLDIAWWALTRRWPAEINPRLSSGYMARPNSDKSASISFSLTSSSGQDLSYASAFDRAAQVWSGKAGRPSIPGLVMYAQVDGSFAVWDPARNYWRTKGGTDIQDRPPAYVFGPKDVWDGLRDDGRGLLCNGLILDWAGWQKENGEAFALLSSVLKTLLTEEGEGIRAGELTRISLDDPRDIPTLVMPYGLSVPLPFASAGMKRILALSYLLVWSWEEHRKASAILGQKPTSQIIFLVDEIESHLHPRWQRSIIASLLNVVTNLASDTSVQIITATHSPLLLASLEPLFDPEHDAWFDLDLVGVKDKAQVAFSRRPFERRGDASAWLTSPAFDLKSGRSAQAEAVLEEATRLLSGDSLGREEALRLDARLHEVLSDTDPFWMRWRFVAEKKDWLK
jgi:hypothetical protein